jgi:hypothetical protein
MGRLITASPLFGGSDRSPLRRARTRCTLFHNSRSAGAVETLILDRWLAATLACALSMLSASAAGQVDPPDPEVYLRVEDQVRARLIRQPCTEADVGHGCDRLGSKLIRRLPCTSPTGPGIIGFLPTDQCFKMEPQQRYRGLWVNEFEGQRFIAEGAAPPDWPSDDPQQPGWREQFERARSATIWLDVSRVELNYPPNGQTFLIEFVGRKTMYPGNHGHMGLSAHEIIVDRVMSLSPCPETGACG